MVIRLDKADTAFLYRLLEGYEYYAHYTTLPGNKADGFRDVQLSIGQGLEAEFNEILRQFPLQFRIISK